MKKRTKAVIATALVALGFAVVPTAASAHQLPMSYARDAAANVAFDWFLGPDWDTYWVDWCRRHSAHKVSCYANVQGTTYGDLHCGTYSCWSTDTTQTCWKRVRATLKGRYVRYSVGAQTCQSTSDTDRY
jgi:hypothetical protein